MARFASLFAVAFLLLQWGYQSLGDSAAYRFYLEQLTVKPSAALIQIVAAQDRVMAQGHRLAWPGGHINVRNACDGMEVMQLLVAAFIVVPGAWRMRLAGMVVGLGLVYLMNLLRLLALYFALRHDRAWFEWIHGLGGPLLLIALTTLFFAWWTAPHAAQEAA